jgi:ferrochelatase
MSQKGVLLVNLGSPDSASVADVRKYLREFLMDPRVLDTSWPIRWCVVNLAILPKRPIESAAAYHKVWTPEGSPLVATSRHVQRELQQRVGDSLTVELAMRYQNPGIESALLQLRSQGVQELLVFPLFPHYAMSSFETAVVRVRELASHIAPEMDLKIAAPF